MKTNRLRVLEPTFFQRDTRTIARALLGVELVHETPAGRAVGRIVETEAYLSEGDGASHSRSGLTPRCASMFLPAGHAYVYLIYGVHFCFNVVTGAEGLGEAVLIRALEPLEGAQLMARRRGPCAPGALCDGPGKLAQALGIRPEHDGASLLGGPLHLRAPLEHRPRGRVRVSPRIGISRSRSLPLRFVLESKQH